MLPGFHAYNRTLKKYKFCADLDMKTAQFISIMWIVLEVVVESGDRQKCSNEKDLHSFGTLKMFVLL